MPISILLVAAAAIGLIASLVQIGLRLGWANAGTARRASGGWWILTVVTVGFWSLAVATGISAAAKGETARALNSLKVVKAQDVIETPALLNTPVVIQDLAFCAEPMVGHPDALATQTKMSGEDEIEGEESDYITTTDFGTEQDVTKFTLGSATSPLRVNIEELTVLPAGPAQTRTIDGTEFSAVVGRNLQEVEALRAIPCGAEVSVTGVVFKEGEFFLLDPLPKNISIVTDRPWANVLATAQNKASVERSIFFVWLILALIFGGGQLAGAVMARGKS